MLKYVDTRVVFAEIPDEITLAINISNCPCHCKGCHSAYLAEDIGTILDREKLVNLIQENKGITCIAFMGGDSNPEELNDLAFCIRILSEYPYKVAWYSGRQDLSRDIDLRNFDYIKLGPYIEEKGPLDNPNTNQKFYEVCRISKFADKFALKDITSKFWKQ